MSQASKRKTLELLFWTKIMSDHGRLIKASLQPDNPNQVLIAVNSISTWGRLNHKIQSGHELETALTEEIISTGLSFREYQRELLGNSLRQDGVTSLTPTVYNHLLNELEEFLKFINDIQDGTEYSGSILGKHLVWILDSTGHAAIIGGNLDQAEALYRDEAKAYENAFLKMYHKAVELAGFYRSDSAAVQPVLEHFNLQIIELMQEFIKFQAELQEGLAQHRILGSLYSWLMEHMIREENYYLRQLGLPTGESNIES